MARLKHPRRISFESNQTSTGGALIESTCGINQKAASRRRTAEFHQKANYEPDVFHRQYV